MSEIVKHQISSALSPRAAAEFGKIVSGVPAIASALEEGGWIAGGFARNLLLDLPAADYFSDTRDHKPGDIDIFFPSVESANRAIDRAKEAGRGVQPSFGGFAVESSFKIKGSGSSKIQFVNHESLVRPSINETLEAFDIANCRVAITKSEVYYSDDWHALESKKLIRVCHGNTPFLGSRILKYLEHRGLDGLTEDSNEMLTGWFAHACKDFNERKWEPGHINGSQGHIKRLYEKNLMKRDHLIFFIGKYHEVIKSESYGESMIVDWALHKMGVSAA